MKDLKVPGTDKAVIYTLVDGAEHMYLSTAARQYLHDKYDIDPHLMMYIDTKRMLIRGHKLRIDMSAGELKNLKAGEEFLNYIAVIIRLLGE